MYRQIRLRMSPPEVSSKSRIIIRKLINDFDWTKYQTVCVFQPIEKFNEIDTAPLVKRLKNQGIEVKLLGKTVGTEFPSDKFNLIIVPCLAFDSQNYRLGWGGGWYDKFLAGQPKALKVGLSFANGLVEAGFEHQAHDIPLDRILTEV